MLLCAVLNEAIITSSENHKFVSQNTYTNMNNISTITISFRFFCRWLHWSAAFTSAKLSLQLSYQQSNQIQTFSISFDIFNRLPFSAAILIAKMVLLNACSKSTLFPVAQPVVITLYIFIDFPVVPFYMVCAFLYISLIFLISHIKHCGILYLTVMVNGPDSTQKWKEASLLI